MADQQTEPSVYRIRTVLDFANVPTDRREVCLREFDVWLSMNDAGRQLLSGIEVKWPDEFIWLDDDRHTMTLSVETPDGQKIPVASGTIKGF